MQSNALRSGLAGLLTLALATCATDPPAPDLCSDADVVPSPAPLAVGDTTRLTVSFDTSTGCTPPVVTAQLRWFTTDEAITRVDSMSGVAVGVAPGAVDIVVRSSGVQQPIGTGRVVVFAPLFGRIIATRFRIRCPTSSCIPWYTNGPRGIWTVAADGSDARLLRDSLRYPDHARVSPDGRAVVFEEWGSLYVLDGAGLTVRLVDTGLPTNIFPSWSPDGRWIVFSAYVDASARFQVFVIRPDGTGLRRLTSDPVDAREPAWSPDGTTIVYVRELPESPASAAIAMDTAGANVRIISSGIVGFCGHDPQWSPDGAAIVFRSFTYLTRLHLATTRYDTLAPHADNRSASWSPDGGHVIAGSGEIYIMDPARPSPYYEMSVLRGLAPDSMYNMAPFYTPLRPGNPLRSPPH